VTVALDSRRGRFGRPRHRTLITAAVILVVGAQFVPVDRTNPPVVNDPVVGPALDAVLHRSCYDCHSNETRWPWYSRVAPASWLLGDHVKEGREHLNFSDWPSLDFELQDQYLRMIAKEVSGDHMPPATYLLIHRNARLGPAEKKLLLDWAQGG